MEEYVCVLHFTFAKTCIQFLLCQKQLYTTRFFYFLHSTFLKNSHVLYVRHFREARLTFCVVTKTQYSCKREIIRIWHSNHFHTIILCIYIVWSVQSCSKLFNPDSTWICINLSNLLLTKLFVVARFIIRHKISNDLYIDWRMILTYFVIQATWPYELESLMYFIWEISHHICFVGNFPFQRNRGKRPCYVY